MSSRKAGVTRTLRWVRVGQDLDLLDAPGVLPPRFEDQKAALKLALCDDIGQASYEVESVAIAFLRMLGQLEANIKTGVALGALENRYGLPLERENPEHWLMMIAERHTSSNKSRMAQRILDDYRQAFLGLME